MRDQIKADLKSAMQAGEKNKVMTLRGILAAVQSAALEKRSDLDTNEIVAVLQKEVKKRNEAARMYEQGGSPDRAEQELFECGVIESYLPEKMSADDLQVIVDKSIEALGAASMADMGKVISDVREKTGASADGSEIAKLVKAKLNSK